MNHLLTVSDINTTVRTIAITSESLSMTALNAMLFSRNAGGRSDAFAAVTSELRKFSRDLNQTMESLAVHNHAVVERLAKMTAYKHRENILLNAVAQSSDWVSQGKHLQLLEKKQQEFATIKHQLNIVLGQFMKNIRHITHICKTGETLALLIKIESKGSRSNVAELDEISEMITNTISSISQMVDSISEFHTKLYNELYQQKTDNNQIKKLA